jgi:hypothetical protein
MKQIFVPSLLVLCALSACQSSESAAPAADDAPDATASEWTVLFDGETTAGWRGFKQDSCPEGWQAVDGNLTRVTGGGDIITTEQYESFELKLEWRIAEGGNSGILFHVSEEHDHIWQTGPELQILDNAKHPDGQAALTSAGSNYALHAPPSDVTRPVGEFNEVVLIVDGARVEQHMNGQLQCTYVLWSEEWVDLVAASKFASMPDYGMRKSGHIALQDHGDEVAFRNISIRRLP